MVVLWVVLAVLAVLVAVAVWDLVQTRHSILRNFPLVGHLRYILEGFGPELRQYIVTGNDEERPFSRDDRRWVYASAKRQNNYFGFGTDNDLESSPNTLIVRHAAIPLSRPHQGEPGYDPRHPLPCGKVLGGPRGRARAFRPESIVNISAMSFGSLSGAAIRALNEGAALAGCLHNTGEGGVSPHHDRGGELIWQIGTGYFGCRDERGGFDLARLKETVERFPVRAIEVKLSQGAKPGHGGVLPGEKVTPEIAAIRGIPVGKTCLSPAAHTAFSDVDSMLDFVERIADETGLPVGIKSAIGDEGFWHELVGAMESGNRGIDFLSVDGGEGGTGAAPLTFADHVSLPFAIGMSRVYRIFAEAGLADRVVFSGAGRLGLPDRALLGLALGCDLIAVAREAMLAIGCIQAKRCHTGHCPTGVATQNRWLERGLVPADKAPRFANYVITLRRELDELAAACGVSHPSRISLDRLDILDDRFGARSARDVFGYREGWGLAPSSPPETSGSGGVVQ